MPSVDVDNALGVALAVQHLRALGHARIAFLGGEPNMVSAVVRRGRRFATHGKQRASRLCRSISQRPRTSTPRLPYRQARHLLCLPLPPTAIVAGNDQIAIAALDAARDLKIAVPEQLSVTGFDDIPDAARLPTPLTTVRQPFYRDWHGGHPPAPAPLVRRPCSRRDAACRPNTDSAGDNRAAQSVAI